NSQAEKDRAVGYLRRNSGLRAARFQNSSRRASRSACEGGTSTSPASGKALCVMAEWTASLYAKAGAETSSRAATSLIGTEPAAGADPRCFAPPASTGPAPKKKLFFLRQRERRCGRRFRKKGAARPARG